MPVSRMVSAAVVFLALSSGGMADSVRQAARSLPLVADVDVLVVGGTTGAVAAAAEAARHGARVFLCSPRPFLGEDMTATLRLWLEPGEIPTTPLARRLFDASAHTGHEPCPPSLPFTYTANLPHSGRHPDNAEHSLLRDGCWHRASSDSVQYDGDVTLTADLGEEQTVATAAAYVFHRSDYSLATMQVSWSRDGQMWSEPATVENTFPPQAGPESGAAALAVDLGCSTRYVRFTLTRAEGSTRVLIGEIELVAPGQAVSREAVERMAVRPLHVKRVLDDELLDSRVDFIYSTYATDVLRDVSGDLCGVVLANRSGLHAVRARAIIDATHRGTVARLAGVEMGKACTGRRSFRRVVIGGDPRKEQRWRMIEPPLCFQGHHYPVIEYTLDLELRSDDPSSWAELEQTARDMTYHPQQQFASEVLWYIPTVNVHAAVPFRDRWVSVTDLPTGAFRPAAVNGLFVLSGVADIPREQVERLLRPCALIEMGLRLGTEAAAVASQRGPVRMPGGTGEPAGDDGLREPLQGLRPWLPVAERVWTPETRVPILGNYDAVIVGGGTSGAPAAIAAGRQGISTVTIEMNYGLGGVGTLGAISKYCHGFRGGFTAEVPGGASWQIEERAEWWRSEIRRSGGGIWLGTVACGAYLEGDRVAGVVVATPEGRGVVLGRTIIDATGNADIAAAAGAPCVYTDEAEIAQQGTGLPPRNLGASYTNTDFTIADETDTRDITGLFVYAKRKYGNTTFDQATLVDTRERRRIDGRFTVNIRDILLQRTYPDTVLNSVTNYDTHGYTIDPFFVLSFPPKGTMMRGSLPYRSLFPRDLRGLLVIGLGLSVHRDAQPVIRMQPDLQNLGYAAGVAVALACRDRVDPAEISIRELQRRLVEKGCLPPTVLNDTDSFPPDDECFRQAVASGARDCRDIAVLLTDPARALPLLRKVYSECTESEARLRYAEIMAVMGLPDGVPELIRAVSDVKQWDSGWNFRAMGQFGSNMSRLDTLIYALGCAGDPRAVPAILEKAGLLDADTDFSHHRAVSLALGKLRVPAAAPVLAEILARPGMSGFAFTDLDRAVQGHVDLDRSMNALRPRRRALRELGLARALFLCGDCEGVGRKILNDYSRDLRGHFARHAAAVLREVP